VSDACRFFDHMADLIDPRFYYDDKRDAPNPRYLKKAARHAARAEAKVLAKATKRAKLDPDAALTTVSEVQRSKAAAKAAEKVAAAAKRGGGGQPPAPRGGAAELGPGSAAAAAQKGMQFTIGSGALTGAAPARAFARAGAGRLCVACLRPPAHGTVPAPPPALASLPPKPLHATRPATCPPLPPHPQARRPRARSCLRGSTSGCRRRAASATRKRAAAAAARGRKRGRTSRRPSRPRMRPRRGGNSRLRSSRARAASGERARGEGSARVRSWQRALTSNESAAQATARRRQYSAPLAAC
jgi:hypothetical protein